MGEVGMATPERILITGAAGGIGMKMRSRLRRPDRVLRLLDLDAVAPPMTGEPVEIMTGSLTDATTMAAACQDVDAIIHLGGISREAGWDQILAVNVDGTHTVLAAAQQAGISRIVLASSNHAVGFHVFGEAGASGIPGTAAPLPDTYYGFSKVAVEALGSLYHSRFGMNVICVRIGCCFDRPDDVRGLSMWLSPNDCARLFEACLSAEQPGYRLIWGVSANTRVAVSLREATELGYHSEDDSEQFAAEILASREPAQAPLYLGGPFTETPLGKPNPL
jgi:NADP-dependent aldehyde dehydrogenase